MGQVSPKNLAGRGPVGEIKEGKRLIKEEEVAIEKEDKKIQRRNSRIEGRESCCIFLFLLIPYFSRKQFV